MPLILPSESDIEDQYKLTIKQAIKSEASEQCKDDNVVKGKRLQLQCSELITNRVCVCCHLPTKKSQVSSYYPGHGDHSHVQYPQTSYQVFGVYVARGKSKTVYYITQTLLTDNCSHVLTEAIVGRTSWCPTC
jgi:hypothetical protein